MHDLRFAFRQLCKSPSFTCIALLTLALGIGACTAIFTVVNAVLLRPVSFPEAERVMVIRETFLPQFPEFAVAPANFRDWLEEADAFESMYALRIGSFNLAAESEPVRVSAHRVTGGFFETLRVQPAIGRAFGPAEDEPGKSNVVVLSHAFWQQHLGGRTDVVGEILRLNGEAYTILGVMPETFQRGSPAAVWVPLAFTNEDWQNRGGHTLGVVGRLKPGATPEQAQAQLSGIAARLSAQYPDTNKSWGVLATPILDYSTRSLRPTLYALVGAVAFLLLIACANVANLLLARATARQREVCIRAALGASRGRVVRQLLTENIVLAIIGGALGVLVAHWGLDALLAIAPSDLPRGANITLDARALGFTLGIALLTGIGFGLAPAWQSARVNLVDAIKEGSRGTSDSGHRHWLRASLVVAEIALALMLLTGAGLLIRSFGKLLDANPGFEPRSATMINLTIPGEKYPQKEQQLTFIETVLERLRALPGVTAAGVAHVLPFSGADYVLGLEIEGRPVPPSDLPSTNYFVVSPDYFRAMGIPVLRGRAFTEHDRAGSSPVAIISQSLANQFFPGEDPIGKRINMTNGPQTWREIVGVVADVKHSSFVDSTAPQSYDPIAQQPFPFMSFVVRTENAAAAANFAATARREIYAVDAAQPVTRIEPLEKLVADSMARERFAMILFGVFSALALLLAAIGIYGVMAYAVSQRTGEFGIRAALGAQPADVLRLVLGQGFKLVVLGIGAGAAGAIAASRVVESLLYETAPRDPLVLSVIAVLLAAVALLACLVPALRATRVSPITALRAE
jgi:putative ABC transport system permease protein